jgi:hypothetical protein
MVAETFFIICPLCGSGWEVPKKLANFPRRAWIRLPRHEQIDDHCRVRRGVVCPGGTRPKLAGLPAGTRENWEQEWRSRFGEEWRRRWWTAATFES